MQNIYNVLQKNLFIPKECCEGVKYGISITQWYQTWKVLWCGLAFHSVQRQSVPGSTQGRPFFCLLTVRSSFPAHSHFGWLHEHCYQQNTVHYVQQGTHGKRVWHPQKGNVMLQLGLDASPPPAFNFYFSQPPIVGSGDNPDIPSACSVKTSCLIVLWLLFVVSPTSLKNSS